MRKLRPGEVDFMEYMRRAGALPCLEVVDDWLLQFRPRVKRWWRANPKRRICKVDFFGRNIDLRRHAWIARLNRERARLIKDYHLDKLGGAA